MGKTSDGSQVLHVQAEKADDLDLSDLYPDAHVVSDSEISSKLHAKIIVEFLKATCKRTQQLLTLLGQQCWELLRPFRQWCANGCNNSQQCWDLQCIVGWSRKPYGLYPCVMRVRGQQQQCWKRCENGSNIDPTSASTEQKKYWDGQLLAQTFDRFQTLRNNSQQCAATYNNIQHRLHTDATCNIQQCWELLASNVPFVCTGLNVLVTEDVSLSCFVFMSQERANQRTQGVMGSMQTTGARQGQIPHICTLSKLNSVEVMHVNEIFIYVSKMVT